MMKREVEIDDFARLEERINALIGLVGSLRKDKDALAEKIQDQEVKITDLNREVEQLKAVRDNARARVVSLLEKIEGLDIG